MIHGNTPALSVSEGIEGTSVREKETEFKGSGGGFCFVTMKGCIPKCARSWEYPRSGCVIYYVYNSQIKKGQTDYCQQSTKASRNNKLKT